MNRGIARRPVFEGRADVRRFLALVARAIRRREIEVHAYSVLTTHYHLLVRSPQGLLSEGMRRVQNEYVRWFNRRRRRDGPLFRGRFHSKPVASLTYRRMLVRYIDQNAPQARLVQSAEHYPYGSAVHYATHQGPPWLSRAWVEHEACRQSESTAFDWPAYRSTFGRPLTDRDRDLVDCRVRHPGHGPDPLDDLVGSAPECVREWMRRKTKLADGTRPGIPIASPATILNEIALRKPMNPTWRIRRGKMNVHPWTVIQVWLLRHASGQSQAAIATRLEMAEGAMTRVERLHATLLSENPEYERVTVQLLQTVLRSPS